MILRITALALMIGLPAQAEVVTPRDLLDHVLRVARTVGGAEDELLAAAQGDFEFGLVIEHPEFAARYDVPALDHFSLRTAERGHDLVAICCEHLASDAGPVATPFLLNGEAPEGYSAGLSCLISAVAALDGSPLEEMRGEMSATFPDASLTDLADLPYLDAALRIRDVALGDGVEIVKLEIGYGTPVIPKGAWFVDLVVVRYPPES